ncbi:MAG: ABC transporter ATP-binding protein [Candidatus Planktophila sp.]|nr:ABC transporter ATP-binding protein [Candidatus Planktophila sp.]
MINFSNVSLIYPTSTKTILEDLSFSIVEGELVLVIGSTGTGKTSLLQLINGLVPHHTGGILAGDITVDGISTKLVRPGELAHLVGIVGQNPSQGFVTDTVEEELAFGMEALNLAPDLMRKRVEEILDLLALAHLRNRAISTLSGGEQQRVAIGSALVMHPKVLVLDEPTSALDPIAAEEVLSILHRLVHDLSLTVVIAEHRLERVIGFADRIIHIAGDGNAKIDLPETILKNADIAPPIVHLARALGLSDVGLSVRDVRRMTETIRDTGKDVENVLHTLGDERILAKDLTIKYGSQVVLKSLNVSVRAGEIVALMGRNGAGKSSLLTALVGLQKPTSGTSHICGKASNDLKGSVRREAVGFIPQEPSDLLYGQSVVGECSQGDKDNQIATGTTFALLQRIVPSISPNTHPRDLSEGQRLALALSIVLSAQPQVLILDEPTRGLDYQSKALLIGLLQNYSRELGRCVLIATHDVELVAELADRVIFLADGEIVADGPTLDILLSSPAFAPQVAKVMSPRRWLTVADVIAAMES